MMHNTALRLWSEMTEESMGIVKSTDTVFQEVTRPTRFGIACIAMEIFHGEIKVPTRPGFGKKSISDWTLPAKFLREIADALEAPQKEQLRNTENEKGGH